MKQSDEIAVAQCAGLFNMLTVEGCPEMGLFRYLSNLVFGSRYFRRYITYEGHLFFSKCSKYDINFRNV